MHRFALIALFLAGGSLTAQDGTKADVRGIITAANASKAKDVLGSIRVEGKVEKGLTTYDKASIRITTKTKIEKLEGTTRKAATVEDLKVGARIQATFVGPVAESYPVQATAGAILIVEAAK